MVMSSSNFVYFFSLPLIFDIINIWVVLFHWNTNRNHIQLESIGFNALNWIFQNMAITIITDFITKIRPNYEALCNGFCENNIKCCKLMYLMLYNICFIVHFILSKRNFRRYLFIPSNNSCINIRIVGFNCVYCIIIYFCK